MSDFEVVNRIVQVEAQPGLCSAGNEVGIPSKIHQRTGMQRWRSVLTWSKVRPQSSFSPVEDRAIYDTKVMIPISDARRLMSSPTAAGRRRNAQLQQWLVMIPMWRRTTYHLQPETSRKGINYAPPSFVAGDRMNWAPVYTGISAKEQ